MQMVDYTQGASQNSGQNFPAKTANHREKKIHPVLVPAKGIFSMRYMVV